MMLVVNPFIPKSQVLGATLNIAQLAISIAGRSFFGVDLRISNSLSHLVTLNLTPFVLYLQNLVLTAKVSNRAPNQIRFGSSTKFAPSRYPGMLMNPIEFQH